MKNNGFTLIELMIVIAIIFILLAICAPIVSKYGHADNSSPAGVYPDRSGNAVQVQDKPDFKTCQFVGLDPNSHSTFKCPDGKVYTN